MPTAHRFHVQIPANLWERFKRIAKTNRRKLKEEALIAIEAHVKSHAKREARTREP